MAETSLDRVTIIKKQATRRNHADGTFSDYLTVSFPSSALKFVDVDQDDDAVKLADMLHYRYRKALFRGAEKPVIVAYALPYPDQSAAQRFPTCSHETEQGETLVSANSLITYTMRGVFERGWIRYNDDGRWQLQVPESERLWQARAAAVLQLLIDNSALVVRSDQGEQLDFAKVTWQVAHDLVGVGRCAFLSTVSEQVSAEFIFNSTYFLLEPDDVFSHHSALCEAYGFWMADGVIERPPLFRRGAIWQHADGHWEIGRLGLDQLEIHLPDGMRLVPEAYAAAVTGQPFSLNPTEPTDITIYTRYFGVSKVGHVVGHTPIAPDRFELIVIDRRVVSWHCGGGLTIPHNALIISFASEALPNDAQRALVAEFGRNHRLTYHFASPVQKTIKQGLQTGPILLKNGTSPLTDEYIEAVEQFWPSRYLPDGRWQIGVVSTEYKTDINQTRTGRAGIGIDAAGDLVVVMAPGVNSGYGVAGIDTFGATLLEITTLLKQGGAVDALNLDGGGSTQAYFQGMQAIVPGDRRGQSQEIFERMVPSVGIVS